MSYANNSVAHDLAAARASEAGRLARSGELSDEMKQLGGKVAGDVVKSGVQQVLGMGVSVGNIVMTSVKLAMKPSSLLNGEKEAMRGYHEHRALLAGAGRDADKFGGAERAARDAVDSFNDTGRDLDTMTMGDAGVRDPGNFSFERDAIERDGPDIEDH